MDMGLTLLSGPCAFENNLKNTVVLVKKGQADFDSLHCLYTFRRYYTPFGVLVTSSVYLIFVGWACPS